MASSLAPLERLSLEIWEKNRVLYSYLTGDLFGPTIWIMSSFPCFKHYNRQTIRHKQLETVCQTLYLQV